MSRGFIYVCGVWLLVFCAVFLLLSDVVTYYLHTPLTITIEPVSCTTLNESIHTAEVVNGNMNIPISAGEVTIDPTTLLFDENLIMNKEITELITNTLLLRDTKEQPLQEHMN